TAAASPPSRPSTRGPSGPRGGRSCAPTPATTADCWGTRATRSAWCSSGGWRRVGTPSAPGADAGTGRLGPADEGTGRRRAPHALGLAARPARSARAVLDVADARDAGGGGGPQGAGVPGRLDPEHLPPPGAAVRRGRGTGLGPRARRAGSPGARLGGLPRAVLTRDRSGLALAARSALARHRPTAPGGHHLGEPAGPAAVPGPAVPAGAELLPGHGPAPVHGRRRPRPPARQWLRRRVDPRGQA